jgi:hypothetical protein
VRERALVIDALDMTSIVIAPLPDALTPTRPVMSANTNIHLAIDYFLEVAVN